MLAPTCVAGCREMKTVREGRKLDVRNHQKFCKVTNAPHSHSLTLNDYLENVTVLLFWGLFSSILINQKLGLMKQHIFQI